MRHDAIRLTHRARAHPGWCTCPSCRPPAPSVRRDPSAQLLLAVPVGFAIGAVIAKADGLDLLVQLQRMFGG